MRVLVVDDDDAVRFCVASYFAEQGHTVAEAPDGRDALRLLGRESPFDLVVTDIIMPDVEGIGLIIKIRDDYPGVRVIAMSGGGKLSAEFYLEAAEMLGANAILEKPFSPGDLLAAVERLFPSEASRLI
jgi:CheY-like chemotaxis protein